MHVFEFFSSLRRAVNIEVIESPLPELRRAGFRRFGKRKRPLRGERVPPFAAKPLRHAQFQTVNHRRSIASLRSTDEQMHVLGHCHVADKRTLVLGAHFAQRIDEHVSRFRGSQQRPAAETTEDDEMQVSTTVIAFQVSGHEKGTGPRCVRPAQSSTRMVYSPRAGSMKTLLKEIG